jgi:hypothetical protein
MSDIKDAVRLEPCSCPHCGYEVDSHTTVSSEQTLPEKDDLSVCFHCANFLKYDQDLKLVPFTEEDISKTDTETLEVLKNIAERVKEHRKKPEL